jgi:hypothetical protein
MLDTMISEHYRRYGRIAGVVNDQRNLDGFLACRSIFNAVADRDIRLWVPFPLVLAGKQQNCRNN